MKQWWEVEAANRNAAPKIRAVANYRHSAQDRQENSIPIQQEQIREWTEKNGVEVIHEFADAGKSGLNAEGRPAFNEMMNEWVKRRDDFRYILCLDVSRWGRFQDIDLSAQYSAECRKHGKEVIYTTIGMPREDDPTMVYNKTTQRLKTPKRDNPPDKWVRTPESFDGIISLEQFLKAQELLNQRRLKYDPEHMLSQLEELYKRFGMCRSSLLRLEQETPKADTYARHFGSLDAAFQQLHREQRERARELVHAQICEHVPEVLTYADFLVLDRKLALCVQPTVPVRHDTATSGQEESSFQEWETDDIVRITLDIQPVPRA